MEKTTVILTRKIQIKIDLPTAEEKKESLPETVHMAGQVCGGSKPYH